MCGEVNLRTLFDTIINENKADYLFGEVIPTKVNVLVDDNVNVFFWCLFFSFLFFFP